MCFYISRSGVARSYYTLCLTLQKAVKLFLKLVVHYYIPIHAVWEFQVLHILVSMCVVSLFNFDHSGGYVVTNAV